MIRLRLPLFSRNSSLASGQDNRQYGLFGLRLGPTTESRRMAHALGAEDKLGFRCTVYKRDDANHAPGLVRTDAARLTQHAQMLVVGTGTRPRTAQPEPAVEGLYRTFFGHCGQAVALRRGDAALLGLAALLGPAGMSPKLAPCLAAALCQKSARYAAAWAYVGRVGGLSRVQAVFVEALQGGGEVEDSLRWRNARRRPWDLDAAIVRATRDVLAADHIDTQVGHLRFVFHTQDATRRNAASQNAATSFETVQSEWLSVAEATWRTDLTAERVALRLAQTLSLSTLRKLDGAQPLTPCERWRVQQVERKLLRFELAGFVRHATSSALAAPCAHAAVRLATDAEYAALQAWHDASALSFEAGAPL